MRLESATVPTDNPGDIALSIRHVEAQEASLVMA
jgi:hypothetical protein